jgi:hypothetical protein
MSTSSVGTGGSSAGAAGLENGQGKKACPPGQAKKDGASC